MLQKLTRINIIYLEKNTIYQFFLINRSRRMRKKGLIRMLRQIATQLNLCFVLFKMQMIKMEYNFIGL